MQQINNPVKIEDLLPGDEVIVRGVDLNYMEIIRPPKPTLKKQWNGAVDFIWSQAVCNRLNTTIFNPDKPHYGDDKKNVRFSFEYKTIWLVKRK